jgi:hypothetical protein
VLDQDAQVSGLLVNAGHVLVGACDVAAAGAAVVQVRSASVVAVVGAAHSAQRLGGIEDAGHAVPG